MVDCLITNKQEADKLHRKNAKSIANARKCHRIRPLVDIYPLQFREYLLKKQ
jgi:hypothetical protein